MRGVIHVLKSPDLWRPRPAIMHRGAFTLAGPRGRGLGWPGTEQVWVVWANEYKH
jgi:hypothetical protein